MQLQRLQSPPPMMGRWQLLDKVSLPKLAKDAIHYARLMLI